MTPMARKKAQQQKKEPAVVYLVQRQGWNAWHHEGRAICTRDEHDEGVPVRAFTSAKAAEACARQLEREARREVNPFVFEGGEFDLLTNTEDEEEFCARV